MFELYKNDSFVLYYENENNTKGFTHLLRFKNLSTEKQTGMWVDPTESNSTLLDNILRLKQLKDELPTNEYNHEVACFIETLIKSAGYTSLQIASLAKDILKHHKNPHELHHTLINVDLSRFDKKLSLIDFDFSRFYEEYLKRYLEEHLDRAAMKKDVMEFFQTLREYITGLLGILITSEDAQKSTSGLHKFGTFVSQEKADVSEQNVEKTPDMNPGL